MKRIFVLLAVIVLRFPLAAQHTTEMRYPMIQSFQNKLLDDYGIHYTGAHVRYMVASGEVNNLEKDIKQSFISAYTKFQNWNKNYFNNIPDTNQIVMNGLQYMENKNTNDFFKMTFNETRKIIGQYSKTVNDKKRNIKTIDILEIYSAGIPNATEHIIMIEDMSGFWDCYFFNITSNNPTQSEIEMVLVVP